MDIFNENSLPYFGIILALLSVIPWILTYTIFRPKYKKISFIKESKKEKILDIFNILIYILCLILFVIYTKDFNIKNANALFGIMCFFYIIYYELYGKYLASNRAQKHLYKPFCYVKIPLYISMSLSLLIASIWAKNIVLIIFTTLFTIINIYSSYKKYINYFTEYRDLYDENRKSVKKKILKDSIVPKGLKYVTVAVLIYNPKNKKWLMQKRTKDKGGKWATTSGHPVSGQTSIQGMVCEIQEELGLKINENELKYVTTINRKDKFVDIYYLEKDIDIASLKIQKEELDDIAWMSEREIDEYAKQSKFKKTHYKYFKEATKLINN